MTSVQITDKVGACFPVVASREKLGDLAKSILALLNIPDSTEKLTEWKSAISDPHFIRAISPNLDIAIERSSREKEVATDSVKAYFLFKGNLWQEKKATEQFQTLLEPHRESKSNPSPEPWKPCFCTHWDKYTDAAALITGVALFVLSYFSLGISSMASVGCSATALGAVKFISEIILVRFFGIKLERGKPQNSFLNANLHDEQLRFRAINYWIDPRLEEGIDFGSGYPISNLRDPRKVYTPEPSIFSFEN